MATSQPVPLVRRELLAQGFRSVAIQHLVRSGQWERPHRGVYLESSLIGESREQVVVQAHLVAAGANAVLSHHSAAAVHKFDSTCARPTGCWVTIPDTRRVAKTKDLHITRSRHLGVTEVELIQGVPATSRARTVLDLAGLIDQQELERVVESAIRGPDHKRPDRYRRNVEQEHRERFRADIARQNKVLVGFNLIRCTGADALFEADRIAREVARYPIVERGVGPFRWESGGRIVSGDGLSWTLGPR